MTQRSFPLLGTALVAASLVLGAGAAQASAAAPVHCSDALEVIGSAGYVTCQGPSLADLSMVGLPAVNFPGWGSFEWVGASDDGSGTFTANPAGGTWGALAMAVPRSGPFVVGLSGEGSVSLYLFDAGTGTLPGLDWDSYGLLRLDGLAGPLLTRAALYVPVTTPVPEPGSLLMLLAGLGAVGWVVRRRSR
jgi:hypothetical protein